ncbi:hypothetical protein OG937_38140 [Streptomyces sp. NBC_00510]
MNELDLRRQLLDHLTADGSVRSPQWRQAVAVTGRHEFRRGGFFRQVPRSTPTAWEPVMPGDEDWLSGCYTDVSLVTQIAATIVPGDIRGRIFREPTSSSTAPGLVVRMLEDLEIEDGMRVREIGTGTGYSTALLRQRLGDDLVTSIEVDPAVAAATATTLATLGHAPDLVTGDGLAGHKDGAPYDRVIATCGVLTIPEQWIAQTRPGGQILAALSGWMHASELARLTLTTAPRPDGSWTGRSPSYSPAATSLRTWACFPTPTAAPNATPSSTPASTPASSRTGQPGSSPRPQHPGHNVSTSATKASYSWTPTREAGPCSSPARTVGGSAKAAPNASGTPSKTTSYGGATTDPPPCTSSASPSHPTGAIPSPGPTPGDTGQAQPPPRRSTRRARPLPHDAHARRKP